MSELRKQIRIAIANHPGVTVVGLYSLLSSSEEDVLRETYLMIDEGIVSINKFGGLKLRPMYTQLDMNIR
jgi:hypothetical protein